MKDYRITAPPRIAAVGYGPGQGGFGASGANGARPPAYHGSPWSAMGGPSSSGNPISDAIAGFLAGAVNSAQIALGVALVGTALLIVLSQTSAGRAAGGAAKGGARLGLRAVPVVGALA